MNKNNIIKQYFLTVLITILYYNSIAYAIDYDKDKYYSENYSFIIADYDSGKIIYEHESDQTIKPASLVKMMTLYILFDYLNNNKLQINDPVYMSRRASYVYPLRLDLTPGSKVTVEEVIKGLIVYSANDLAVAIAEKISRTERQFAELMSKYAKKLHMYNTSFGNASGLPSKLNYTTSLDMIRLATSLLQDFPQYYHYFSLKQFNFRGREINSHNYFLTKYWGAEGLKTGFTSKAGFNLAATARRHEIRLVGVVTGIKNPNARYKHMEKLMNQAFYHMRKLRKSKTINSANSLASLY